MAAAHDSFLYARVETVLAGEITDGDLKVGEQLPTEDSLVARFGVSRMYTYRRADVLRHNFRPGGHDHRWLWVYPGLAFEHVPTNRLVWRS
jgi:hypothetical protein